MKTYVQMDGSYYHKTSFSSSIVLFWGSKAFGLTVIQEHKEHYEAQRTPGIISLMEGVMSYSS